MTHQERKDCLWELENHTAMITTSIAKEVIDAWKAQVEHENPRRHLVSAFSNAQDLANKLQHALNVLDHK